MNLMNQNPPRDFRLIGRPSLGAIQVMQSLNTWMFNKYANHGNVAAHLFGVIRDQVNKTQDVLHEKEFHKNGRSLNRFATRGMFFCGTTMRYYDLRFRKHGTPDPCYNTRYKWGYYLTPILYLYDINAIQKLMAVRAATYFEHKIPTYSHNFSEKVHEIRVHDRTTLPKPSLIIVGKAYTALRASERIDIRTLHSVAGCDILHLPHINLYSNKDDAATGNATTSKNAIRIIECIKSL